MSKMWGKNTDIRRAVFVTVLIFLNLELVFASCNSTNKELRVSLNPKYGDGNLELSYVFNHSFTNATINIFVEKYQLQSNSFSYYGSYDVKKVILREINTNTGVFQISISELEPWLYRLFANLTIDDLTFCAYDDYMLQKNSVTERVIYVERKPNVTISLLSAPSEVSPGQSFDVIINLTNLGEDASLKVYSYVYDYSQNKTELISMGRNKLNYIYSWNANEKDVFLSSGSSAIIALSNRIIENASEGNYNLRVRVKINETKYDLTTKILVKKSVTISRLDFSNNTIFIDVVNHGNIARNASLVLIDDEIVKEDMLIGGKTTKEFSFQTNRTIVFLLLFQENSLIDIKQLNMSLPVKVQPVLVGVNKSSNELIKNEHDVTLTSFSVLKEQQINLYLAMFFICLLSLIILFRRFK
ncbi:MAG: hypothetical protein OH319_00975 [Candidatus Parvarchaeota archaeon]|nr:hypothetical protein [Candidatus Jingweiarchaeum tengchongense]MCW1297853.1 hypothetical protein [Candidatus Jingweiarchaeum tengchongense]MCW1299864.1 hypothetical protein [Candidatus Jingweiarchaeum tengchongense]MCW1304166.1 hypothetical protein [Candidatus Jingweiarchaeum tengchongense]MCW1305194.1 hypothetical protein [Candidatus Jingweiarchaeum tengchongense]